LMLLEDVWFGGCWFGGCWFGGVGLDIDLEVVLYPALKSPRTTINLLPPSSRSPGDQRDTFEFFGFDDWVVVANGIGSGSLYSRMRR
jgi:hypothetical protein